MSGPSATETGLTRKFHRPVSITPDPPPKRFSGLDPSMPGRAPFVDRRETAEYNLACPPTAPFRSAYMPDALSRSYARFLAPLEYGDLPDQVADKLKASVLHTSEPECRLSS